MTCQADLFPPPPRRPRRAGDVLADFGDAGGYRHPRPFFRTANGQVLATVQYRVTGDTSMSMPDHAAMAHAPQVTGGLVLMDERGAVIRTGSAAAPKVADRLYNVALDPATGALTMDTGFHDPVDERPGIAMKGRVRPHGWTGTAIPHATVFSR